MKGQAAITAVIFMLIIILSVFSGISGFALKEASGAEKNFRSRVAFFTAESGVDDAVYRIKRGKNVSSSFSVSLNGSVSTTTINDVLGTKQITSSGEFLESFRSLRAVLFSGEEVDFFYGVQVGQGGVTLGNGTVINGNIFSNGNITGNDKDKTIVTGTAQSAGPHTIKDIKINGDAYAYNFDDCIILGVAHYANNFSGDCSAPSTQVLSGLVAEESLPIAESVIDGWKSDAEAGGTLSGFSIANNSSATLGPKKISGNLTLGNNSQLMLTGAVWITGTISFGNSPTIKLDSSYGSSSGVLIVDGVVNVGNSAAIFEGSGQAGSYLMLLSTFGPGDAIKLGNNAEGAIFYASNGFLDIGNGLNLREATAYGLKVGNDTTITYESDLQNVNFVSGLSGGWTISEWKEVIQ